MDQVSFSWFGAVQALFYAIPIFAANMAPVLVKRLPFLGQPIDGGRLWRGKPILGSHKTWRGLIFGCLAAIIAIYLQALYVDLHGPALALIQYNLLPLAWLGFLMGFGALAGDAIKSFFKRRVGIAAGKSWPVFDQLDFIVGGLLASSLVVAPSWSVVLWLLVLTPFGHLLINVIAYRLHLKEVPY